MTIRTMALTVRSAALSASVVLGLAVVPLVAAANPGDPRVLQGTVVWLPGTSGEPFVVVRADDSKHFVVDLSAAQSRGTMAVGDRVSVAGVEGVRPFEVAAIAVGAGDAVSPPPVSPSASPPTVTAPAPPPAAPERPWRRIDGKVQTISNSRLTLRDADGRVVSIDLSRLNGDVTSVLRPGDDVTVFVTAGDRDDRLVAVGFVHADPAPGSALPRAR